MEIRTNMAEMEGRKEANNAVGRVRVNSGICGLYVCTSQG